MIIYTTGCAKAGTTLMQMMISNGFDGMRHVRMQDRRKLKAKPNEHVSVKCKTRDVAGILKEAGNEIRIIWIIRHPYALLLSRSVVTHFKNYHNHPREVMASFNRLRQFGSDPRILVVKFEELILAPDHVQQRISEFAGLDPVRPFAECHEHFDMGDIEAPALKGARPPDKSRLAPWRDEQPKPHELSRLDSSLKQYPKLIDEMEYHDYTPHVNGTCVGAVWQHERRRKQKKALSTRDGRDERKRIL